MVRGARALSAGLKGWAFSQELFPKELWQECEKDSSHLSGVVSTLFEVTVGSSP